MYRTWCANICRSRSMLAFALALGLATAGPGTQAISVGDPSVFGVFAGSSPCGAPIRQLLGIPPDAAADLMQWRLTLYQDAATRAPSRYELRYAYGSTAPGRPGIASNVRTEARQGQWTAGTGTRSNPDAVVYELGGGLSLYAVDAGVLHVLNPDRSLMIGNGGWSFTLNRMPQPEATAGWMWLSPVTWVRWLVRPETSYPIGPLASGPSVYGVFEGRSPCQAIARELQLPVDPDCAKVKWRVTLYQDPATRAPTTYKVEGSLYRSGARAGSWTVAQGSRAGAGNVVYQLASTPAEPALLLAKGDDNVLFLLDRNLDPLIGRDDFSYTLNRRSGAM